MLSLIGNSTACDPGPVELEGKYSFAWGTLLLSVVWKCGFDLAFEYGFVRALLCVVFR